FFNMSPLRGFTCYGYIFYYKHVAPIGAWLVIRYIKINFDTPIDLFALQRRNKIPQPTLAAILSGASPTSGPL
ncbi:MAG: hypothetical protein JXL67_11410, partial [Calditrichaeota bacterium]|nr:hypothetical protein [Calditrichota bacterium]